MDFFLLIGIILGLISVVVGMIVKGANVAVLINPAAAIIIFVGVIAADETEKLTYDPTNPAANDEGYVGQSNVDIADEMVAMLQAVRTYEANVSASEMNKTILKKALEISKG